MPKVKVYSKDAENERDIFEWVHTGVKCDRRIWTIDGLAKKVGMSPNTLSYRLSHPGAMRLVEFWAIERAIGSLADFLRVREGLSDVKGTDSRRDPGGQSTG